MVGVVYADHRGTGDKLPLMLAPSFGSGAVDEVALKQRTAEHMAGGPSLASLTPDILAKQPGATETFRLSNSTSACSNTCMQDFAAMLLFWGK